MTKRPTDEKAQPGAAQAGDLPARLSADLDGTYRQVMEQYQDRLYAFALRFAGNAEDAEEIVQDAFVRAYRALAGYPAARIAALALRPWLYQITLNTARNRARKRRLNVVSLDGAGGADGDDEENGGPAPANAESERPEAVAERHELSGELAAHLAGLPPRYRAAVILRYVEGLSYAEMAEVLAQPAGTVKSNVHRGIEHLRTQMREEALQTVTIAELR